MTKAELLRFLMLEMRRWYSDTAAIYSVGQRRRRHGASNEYALYLVHGDGEMLPPGQSLSTAEALAIAVLSGDNSAAAPLVDYLQENGIDAVTEATRLERERVMKCVYEAAVKHGDPEADLQVFVPLGELLADIDLLVHEIYDK